MTRYYADNIVALVTAPANGPVGIVRVSGPDALFVMSKLFLGRGQKALKQIKPRHFYFGEIFLNELKRHDQVLAVYMPGPHSFTGEDVVEFHCHGNLYLIKHFIREILSLSDVIKIRQANPGEFSKRAFLNGKIDLTQAESIQEIIASESEAGLKASLANPDGKLSEKIQEIKSGLTLAMALLEASFEFSEEDIEVYDYQEILNTLKKSATDLEVLKGAYATSKLYDNGVTVAIVGDTNAGKSSLLNALLIENRAIVTDVAGTTRDVVEGAKIISGIRFVFKDTAGFRETTDQIESIGIQKSKELIEKSAIVLRVLDCSRHSEADRKKLESQSLGVTDEKSIYVWNKIDLIEARLQSLRTKFPCDIFIAAKNNVGISDLEHVLSSVINSKDHSFNNVHVNSRQFEKIISAHKVLSTTIENTLAIRLSEDVLIEEIRTAVEILDEITGKISGDDVLGEIFSKFCIGK